MRQCCSLLLIGSTVWAPELCERAKLSTMAFLILLVAGSSFDDFATRFEEFVCALEMDSKIFENHEAPETRGNLDPNLEAVKLHSTLLWICWDYLKSWSLVGTHSSLYVDLYLKEKSFNL